MSFAELIQCVSASQACAIFVAAVALAYVFMGRRCFRLMCEAATSYDDLDLIVSTKTTWVGRIGKIALIATWPLWYALPKLFALVRADRENPFATS